MPEDRFGPGGDKTGNKIFEEGKNPEEMSLLKSGSKEGSSRKRKGQKNGRHRPKTPKMRVDDDESDDELWEPGPESSLKKVKIATSKPLVCACHAHIFRRTSEDNSSKVVTSEDNSSKVVDGVESPPTCKLGKMMDKQMLKLTKAQECAGTSKDVAYDQKLDLHGAEKI